jgi:hypothetical protein
MMDWFIALLAILWALFNPQPAPTPALVLDTPDTIELTFDSTTQTYTATGSGLTEGTVYEATFIAYEANDPYGFYLGHSELPVRSNGTVTFTATSDMFWKQPYPTQQIVQHMQFCLRPPGSPADAQAISDEGQPLCTDLFFDMTEAML